MWIIPWLHVFCIDYTTRILIIIFLISVYWIKFVSLYSIFFFLKSFFFFTTKSTLIDFHLMTILEVKSCNFFSLILIHFFNNFLSSTLTKTTFLLMHDTKSWKIHIQSSGNVNKLRLQSQKSGFHFEVKFFFKITKVMNKCSLKIWKFILFCF